MNTVYSPEKQCTQLKIFSLQFNDPYNSRTCAFSLAILLMSHCTSVMTEVDVAVPFFSRISLYMT